MEQPNTYHLFELTCDVNNPDLDKRKRNWEGRTKFLVGMRFLVTDVHHGDTSWRTVQLYIDSSYPEYACSRAIADLLVYAARPVQPKTLREAVALTGECYNEITLERFAEAMFRERPEHALATFIAINNQPEE
jgi:hypothetical protein